LIPYRSINHQSFFFASIWFGSRFSAKEGDHRRLIAISLRTSGETSVIEFDRQTTPKKASETSHLPASSGSKGDHPIAILDGLERTGALLNTALDGRAPVVSIIVPAFNEIDTIQTVVDALVALPIEKQIVVVDDGSSDGTREIISSLKNRPGFDICLHEKNSGKGAAIQSGIKLAIGEIVIVQDADLEYIPADILTVIEPIRQGKASVVFGSRYWEGCKQDGSWIHRLGNRVLTGLSNFASGQRLTDMETCYKAFRRDVIHGMEIEQRRFGFEPEITAKLARRGVSIIEVPIRYSPRSWSEGKKIGIKDLFNTLWCIVRYRFWS
jgi:glycosyltransferase involved in cell wall biosynthesis